MELIETIENGIEMPKSLTETSKEIAEDLKEQLIELVPEGWSELISDDKTSIVREIIDALKDAGIVSDNPIISAIVEIYESPELVAEIIGIAAKTGIIMGGAYFGMDTTAIAEIVSPIIEKVISDSICGKNAIDAWGDLTSTILEMPDSVEEWNNAEVMDQSSWANSLFACLKEIGLEEVGQQIKEIKNLFVPELSDTILSFAVKESIITIGQLMGVDCELAESVAAQIECGISSE